MRRAARTDNNQTDIVKALRAIGAKVYMIKKPVDLLVWCRGRTFLVEVKNPDGFDRDTPEQTDFKAAWPGELHTVRSPIEAVTAAVGAEAMR